MSSNKITIRRAKESGLATMVEFSIKMAAETESIQLDRETVTRGTRAALADESKGRYFVADIDGRVVGQLMLTREWSDWRNGDIWWIQSVYVEEQSRKRGVFEKLYRHVEVLARKEKVVGLRLYVENNNERAKRTYARLGMSITHYDVMEQML